MSEPISQSPPPGNGDRLKIYFLPNLFTAGNLFCGFVALTKIVEAKLTPDASGFVNWMPIKFALGAILLACIFDLFDGRIARMGGRESPFGREFDSLADLVSFGVAPAFLVHRVVLHNALPEEYAGLGWFIASIYLVCGAFRLARFNCLSAMNLPGAGKDFLGFPIPSAAGLVASLTLFIIKLNEKEKDLGHWGYLLPVVLVFLSAMMVSEVRYPSFKSLGLRSSTTFLKVVIAALFVGLMLVLQEKILYYVLPLFFTAYLVYGFVRPRLSRAWRKEIEEDEDDAEAEADMAETHPILLAAIAGFVCALIFASIPVGPINLTILNEGAQRGFKWALLIGLGASVMDAIYCAISFTGLSQFLEIRIVKASMQLTSFVFLLFLGFKFLLAQTVKVPTKLDAASEKIEARLEQKLHPHSAFMTGFVRVLANLGVLVAWVVLSANLMSHDWVDDAFNAKVACIGGVFAGTVFWFCILSFGVSRGQGRFSEKTLLRLQHVSGLCLIAAGLFDGANIAWHLARHKI